LFIQQGLWGLSKLREGREGTKRDYIRDTKEVCLEDYCQKERREVRIIIKGGGYFEKVGDSIVLGVKEAK